MNTEQVLEGSLAHSSRKIIVIVSPLEPRMSLNTGYRQGLQYQT